MKFLSLIYKNKINFKKILGKIFENKLLILIFIFIFIVIALTFRDYGISWDEKDQINLGDTGLKYYLSFGKNKQYFQLFSNQIEVLSTRGPIVEVIRSFFSIILNRHGINFYHLFIAIFALPTFFFVYKIIFLITNHKFVSTISPLFLMFMSRFWGDIFNNSKDILVGLFISIIIFLSIYIYKFFKTTKWYLFVVLGLFFGIACSLRPVAAYLLPLFIIYYSAILFKNQQKNIKKIIKNTLILGISFIVSLHIFLPYLHLKPLFGIIDMVTDSEKFSWVGKMLFEGNFIFSTELPWYYLLKWILISTPLFILFLTVLLLFFIPLKNKHKEDNFIKVSSSFIIFSFFIPVFLVIFMRPIIYDTWRHFLFLSVPLVLMSVLGLFYLINFFKKNKTIIGIIYLFILAGFVITGFSYTKLHPYEYTYFNSLVGGLSGAYGKYETDYWGKSFKESVEWLNKNTPDDKKVYIKTCGHSFSSTYYFKDNFVFTDKIDNADYYICYTRNNEHLLIDDNKTVYIVKRNGVPLNYIKKIK